MKIAFVTTYDACNVTSWSGIPYYMSKALTAQAISLSYIKSLRDKNWFMSKAKKLIYQRGLNKTYLRDRDLKTVRGYGQQISLALKESSCELVFSPSTIPLAYVECQQPIVLWTDCTFAGMIDFYQDFSNLCSETKGYGMEIEQAALEQCTLAIYSSQWAADTAVKYYQVDRQKIRVVPFGANLECNRTENDIKKLIKAKPKNLCKLLFLGVDWQRKGGDTAVKVAQALNDIGIATELTIVGCQPQLKETLPDFIKVMGRISKATTAGKQLIDKLIGESHFLILPTRADCSPMVYSEANSFGVPCLATHVGGASSIISSGKNGQIFAQDASISEYCHFITDIFTNYAKYELLAVNSYHEYQSRLNWNTSAATVRDLLKNLIHA
jgi:glycosyltransferase involved in cell wall biosynthesis